MNPDPDARANMRAVDSLSPAFRDLVHEFGLVIVAAMINDGYDNPVELRQVLETWRARRQSEWLATDYISSKTANSFNEAA
jgi:DnaJ-domain-containing protein 1